MQWHVAGRSGMKNDFQDKEHIRIKSPYYRNPDAFSWMKNGVFNVSLKFALKASFDNNPALV